MQISDIVVFLSWFWDNTATILGSVFLPIKFVYAFLKQFFTSAFGSPITPDISLTFSTSTLTIFNSIPYFDVLMSAMIVGVLLLIIGFIIKTFLKT